MLRVIPAMLLIGLGSFSPTQAASSADELAGGCDRLTANENDPGQKSYWKGGPLPVAYSELDGEAGVKACSNALAANPDQPRLMLNLGRAHNKLGQYRESFEWTEKSAKAGYLYAFHAMSLHYLYGEGVAKNRETENRWTRKAATAGLAVSQYNLGNHYRDGYGDISKDPAKAFAWYKKAAEKGFEPAKVEVGSAILMSRQPSVAQRIEGLSYIYNAAVNGNEGAMLKMAEFFASGVGVRQDDFTALVWAYYAREAGSNRASQLIDFQVNKLTGTQVFEARRRLQKNVCQRGPALGMWKCALPDYNELLWVNKVNFGETIEDLLRRYFESDQP